MIRKILHRPFFIRLLNWEYWPFHVVYAPVYTYWFWLCLRARSFFFFNTSNPTIKNGGFLMESKKEIYDLIPPQYYPATLFFRSGTRPEEIVTALKSSTISFPVIGKPDIGMKGMAVKKLDNENELADYARQSKVDFLVQEFVSYKNEAGIFYYRYPAETKGYISGIVSKEFLSVTGDGVSTIEQLLYKEKRYILQLPVLRKTYKERLDKVPLKGEEQLLVPYGNHVRGAKFIDASHLADEQLRTTMDGVCQKINGFYFGRLDIRYNTWEELKRGENFSIIELNGAGSEPTHMYDPRHTIFFAWKEIARHLKILWRISRQNHRLMRKPYMSIASGLQMFRENTRYVKMISGKANPR